MTTANLNSTFIEFLNGANVDVRFDSSNETLTFFSTTGPNNTVNLNNLQSLQLSGSVSGTFTQLANTTIVTPYSIHWPAAQSTGTQILQNDGSGNLDWVTETVAQSAGSAGDIQYSDGLGGFVASTTSRLRYSDGTTSTIQVGVEDGTVNIDGVAGTTLSGTNLTLNAGTGGTNAGSTGGNIDVNAGAQTNAGAAADAGSINLTAGNGVGVVSGSEIIIGGALGTGDGGSMSLTTGQTSNSIGSELLLNGGSTTTGGNASLAAGNGTGGLAGGYINFTCGSGTPDGQYIFNQAGVVSPLVTILGQSETSTSTTTGTLRVIDSIGLTGICYANALFSNTTLGLLGGVGTFTQQANAATTTYTVKWPAAQSVGTQILQNDGSGNLSWATEYSNPSAGSNNDIQLSNGSGGFKAATTSAFKFVDGTSCVMTVGATTGTFQLITQGQSGLLLNTADSTSGPGSMIFRTGNYTNAASSGNGGSMTLRTGNSAGTSGNGGTITILAGQSTNGDGGSVSITAGASTNSLAGNVTITGGSGLLAGSVVLQGGTGAVADPSITFKSTAGATYAGFNASAANPSSKATGTFVITDGGIGVNQTVWANALTSDTLLNLRGSVSGAFSQQASGTTTSYTVVWPSAQAVGTKLLQNDGSGNLSWVSATSNPSAGAINYIQLSNGAGGFSAATSSTFRYIDGIGGYLEGGLSGSTFGIRALENSNCGLELRGGYNTGLSGAGGTMVIRGGLGGSSGTGNGGDVSVIGGQCGQSTARGGNVAITGGAPAATGNSGSISISTPDQTGASGNAGSITINAGKSTNATGGNITLSLTTGSSVPGAIIFQGGETLGTTETFFFRDAGGNDAMAIISGQQNSTSTTTGSVRITGGLGVTQDIHTNMVYVDSDMRLKSDIRAIEENSEKCLDKILNLHGKRYIMNEKECIGLIAQDTFQVIPEIVKQSPDDHYSINYDGIIPYLIESIKVLNKRVQFLETELVKLTN